MSSLILKRASTSRPSGEWSDDDYDMLADRAVVGRIMQAAASPVGALWMWTLIFGHKGRTPTHGYHARSGDGGVREELAPGVGMPRLSFIIRAMLRRGMS
jgi:hypothetical protein